MKNMVLKKNNCFIISKTSGIFSFKSFKTIQFIINKNTKLYNKVCFKKIPHFNKYLYIQSGDIILEFLISTDINNLLKMIKIITYKISFKLKICTFKK